MSFFSDLRSTLRSWLNLHFLPFSQLPCLKKMQTTVLGSTPKGTFCVWTGLNSSAASLRASSAAFFSAARRAFSASFRFSSAVLLFRCWACSWAICLRATPPFFCYPRKQTNLGICRQQAVLLISRVSCSMSGASSVHFFAGWDNGNLHFSCQRSATQLALNSDSSSTMTPIPCPRPWSFSSWVGPVFLAAS